MRKSDSKYNDIVTSRITVSFFIFIFVSFLSWLYILPFKKHYLVINNYYEIIETVVIILTFLAAAFSFIFLIKSKKKDMDYSEKIITPSIICSFTLAAFVSAVIIPFSNNRTLTYKYCIALFFAVFLAYTTYNLINKAFPYYTFTVFAYGILFAFLDYMYTDNVTFSDKISIPYTSFVIIFIGIIVLITFINYLISNKNKELNILYIAVFSGVALIGIIVRLFFVRYISMIIIALLILSYIFFCVAEKKGIKLIK